VAAMTANDAFKLHYPRYIKGAVLVALALTALFVRLWPGYQAKPYQLRQEEAFEIVEIEPIPTIKEPPIPLEKIEMPPIVEAAPEDDPDAVDTIPDPISINTIFNPGIPKVHDDTGFVASSAQPQLQSHVKADYPEIARRAGLEGTVMVNVRVDRHGRVDRAEIIQSVHPILDRAAKTAALRCRFTPGTQRSIPVPVWVTIPYRFRLN
jgi:protein TonB